MPRSGYKRGPHKEPRGPLVRIVATVDHEDGYKVHVLACGHRLPKPGPGTWKSRHCKVCKEVVTLTVRLTNEQLDTLLADAEYHANECEEQRGKDLWLGIIAALS